jgi:hypothetical protein
MLAGAVEGSNVNPVESMVGMIAASRQFEQRREEWPLELVTCETGALMVTYRPPGPGRIGEVENESTWQGSVVRGWGPGRP